MNNPAPMVCPLRAATVRMGNVSNRANICEQNCSIMSGREEVEALVNHWRSNPLEKNLSTDCFCCCCCCLTSPGSLFVEEGGDNPVTIKLLQ